MPWAVAFTYPCSEQKTIASAAREGITCWAPRYKLIKHYAGRRIERTEFLFPRYVFVLQDVWHSLINVIGIAYLLMLNGKPAMITDDIVQQFKANEVDGFLPVPPQAKLQAGQKVRITHGTFAGTLSVFNGMSSQQRATVLLTLLGSQVKANIDIRDLVAA